MEFLKDLTEREIHLLHKVFLKEGAEVAKVGFGQQLAPPPGLTLEEFVEVMRKAMWASSHTRRRSIAGATDAKLRQLFDQVDFNNDGVVTWEEFTMFIIDGTMKIHVDVEEQKIEKYNLLRTRSTDYFGAVKGIQTMTGLDNKIAKLVTFNHQNWVELLHPSSYLPWKRTSQQAVIIDSVEAIPELQYILTNNRDLSCTLWSYFAQDDTHPSDLMAFSRRFTVRESQCVYRYHQRYHTLFSGSRTGMLNMWSLKQMEEMCRNVSTQKERERPVELTPFRLMGSQVHTDCVMGILPLEHELITASLDHEICVYNLEREIQTARMLGHEQGVTQLAYSHYGQLLISGGCEYCPYVWILHVKNFKPWKLEDKSCPHRAAIVSVMCPDPNAPIVISADAEGFIKVWDIRTLRCAHTTALHTRISSACVANKTSFLVSSAIGLHEMVYDEPANPTQADDNHVVFGAHNSELGIFMTAHGDTVKLWSDETGCVTTMLPNIVAPKKDLSVVCIDANFRKFFVATHEGSVEAFSMATGVMYKTFQPATAVITCMCHIAIDTRRYLLVGTQDGQILLHEDGTTGDGCMVCSKAMRALRRNKSADVEVTACCATPSGMYFCVVGTSGIVVIAETRNREVLHRLRLPPNSDGSVAEGTCLRALGHHPYIICGTTRSESVIFAITPHECAGSVVCVLRRPAKGNGLEDILVMPDIIGSSLASDITAFAYCDKTRLLAIAQDSGMADLYRCADLTRPTYVMSWHAHKAKISVIDFCTIQSTRAVGIMTVGCDYYVRLWDTAGKSLGMLCQGRSTAEKNAKLCIPPFALQECVEGAVCGVVLATTKPEEPEEPTKSEDTFMITQRLTQPTYLNDNELEVSCMGSPRSPLISGTKESPLGKYSRVLIPQMSSNQEGVDWAAMTANEVSMRNQKIIKPSMFLRKDDPLTSLGETVVDTDVRSEKDLKMQEPSRRRRVKDKMKLLSQHSPEAHEHMMACAQPSHSARQLRMTAHAQPPNTARGPARPRHTLIEQTHDPLPHMNVVSMGRGMPFVFSGGQPPPPRRSRPTHPVVVRVQPLPLVSVQMFSSSVSNPTHVSTYYASM